MLYRRYQTTKNHAGDYEQCNLDDGRVHTVDVKEPALDRDRRSGAAHARSRAGRPDDRHTAWARVESGEHFPSDTLFGIALGNFFAAFVNDAFLGSEDSGTGLQVAATADGAAVTWQVRF